MANMTQTMGVNLIFTADTGQAKMQLQELKNTLNSLSTSSNVNGAITPLTTELRSALDATTQLSAALKVATNVDTGRLDLTKFSQSLRATGLNLQQLSTRLTSLGAQGEKAFLQLSQAVVSGEVPLKRSNALMGELWHTMKNTAKWQLSSSVLHGFISSVQTAYSYAQDLNKSLNDIRVVTNYSSDSMASFAKQANKAAKALNTTTKNYTEASLIYFQQGLGDKAIEERTATTIKMANVTGESAQEVSDYMTAVWNNFHDGSQELEYYADVMAKLGAETASSTDEIAAGLEKFSAIADTVGLSFEYATSALATVTAETRQSADVVGTAFKTLFARIEGLSLGETLEDGTDLNKYSQALAVVGINIKDASGGLKDMDQILSEMGERWQSLTKDQQVALAQAVGGIRQYNQLISLMDNWDVMQKNLERTKDAAGTLDRQAEIYADSWDAASKRVEASAEAIYTAIINDDFFIDLTQGFAGFLEMIEKFASSIGGLPGIISLLGTVLLHAFGPHIAESINNMWNNFLIGSGLAAAGARNVKQEMLQALDAWNKYQNTGSASDLEVQYQKQLLNMVFELQEASEHLTEQEKQRLQIYLEMVEAFQNAAVESQRLAETASTEATEASGQVKETGIDDKNMQEINSEGAAFGRVANAITQDQGLEGDLSDTDFIETIAGSFSTESSQANLTAAENAFAAAGDKDVAKALGSYNDIVGQSIADVNKIKDGGADIDTTDLEKAKNDYTSADKDYQEKLENYKKAKGKKNIDATKKELDGAEEQRNQAQSRVDQEQQRVDSFTEVRNLEQEYRDNFGDGSKIMKGKTKEESDKLKSDLTTKIQGSKEKAVKADLKAKEGRGGEEAKKMQKNRKVLKEYGKEQDKLTKSTKKWSKAKVEDEKINADNVKVLEEFGEKAVESGKRNGEAAVQLEKANKVSEDYGKALKNSGQGIDDLGKNMTRGLQGVSSFAMGLSSLQGAFDAINNPDLSGFEKFTTVAMSLGMGLPSIIDGVSGMAKGFDAVGSSIYGTLASLFAHTAAQEADAAAQDKNTMAKSKGSLIDRWKNSETIQSTLLTMKNTEAEKKNKAAQSGSVIAKLAHAAAQAVLTAAMGPFGVICLVIVAILLVMVAVIIALIAVYSAMSKAQKEKNEQTLKEEKANQELIKSNQELSSSVRDLIDQYQEFKESGKSTYETIEKLKEQMPDLIDSYKELQRNLGIDLDVEALEQLYQAALTSGNWDKVEMKIKAIEAEVVKAEQLSYETGSKAAGRLMTDAGKEGKGRVVENDSAYKIDLGGYHRDDKHAVEVLDDVFAKQGISDYITSSSGGKASLQMDLTSPVAMVNYYEGLQEVQSKLEAEGETSSALYSQITEELNQMSEAYGEAKIQADAFLESLTTEIDSSDANFKEMFGLEKNQIDSLSEYNKELEKLENGEDNIISHYAELKGITEEEAKAAIEASEAFSQFANANSQIDAMSSDLAQGNSIIADYEFKPKLQQLYEELPESDRTLMLGLDLNVADIDTGNLRESIKKEIEKARENAIVADVQLEATELKFDESTFEAYADILQDTNDHLEDNKAMAYKVALQNARMSKGLITLTENFKDHVSVLAKGNRSSYEYAEAIGALKDGFEEMFGYKPSTVYIEGHLEEIQDLANGNLEALKGLQDDLAKDYVLNMEVATAIDGDGMSTDKVRNELIEGLEAIDTSIEVGEGTTISDDFLNSMQAMIDQGQVTEEQMQEIFRMKGIEMKVTGYKSIPGPKTTTVQTITNSLGFKTTKTIEEQQDIQVPIINGDDSGIYAANANGTVTATDKNGNSKDLAKASKAGEDAHVAEFVKGPDSSTIDSSAFEDASGQKEIEEKIKALEEEKDLYHQINEEIKAIERQMGKLERAEERAFGGQKLAQMQETLKSYEAEVKKQEEAAKLYGENAEKYGQQLINEYGISLNTGTGVISNWNEVEARELSYLESAYRSGDEKAIEEAEARWEAYQQDVANYEEALDAKNDAEEEAQEYRDKIYDKYLEGLEYELEIKLMVDDRELEYLEYMLSKLEDDAFSAAEQIALLGDQTQTLVDKSNAYSNNINTLLGKHGITADQAANMSNDELIAAGFTEAEVESLNEWSAELLSVNQELMETKKQVEESLMAEYDAWMEDMDQEIAIIEHASSVLSHYNNIIDIAGKKHLGFTDEMMQDLSQAQLDVANNNLEASKAKYDAAVQSKATIEAELEAAKQRLAADPGNEELQKDVEYWEEQLQTVNTSIQESQDQYLSNLEASLEAAKNLYIQMVESTLSAFEEGVSKTGKTLEQLSTDMSRKSEEDDRYLEDYQKMYELNKLSRDLETKLNKSTSLAEQKALREQLEKINKLKAEDVEMSEHDLSVLQKQVEVEQARIAMQEAQNAKTQVIRHRDSEGNWGYVYTADADQSAEAIQNYEDKMYELMELNDTYLDDLSQSIIDAQTEMRDAIAALSEEDFASKEEYMAAVKEIQDYYGGLINYYYDEMNKTIRYNQEVYATDLETRLGWSAESIGISQEQLIALSEIRREDYDSLDEYYAAIEERTGLDKETIRALEEQGTLTRIEEVSKQKLANEDLQTSFADTRYAQVTEYDTMKEAQTDFTDATNTMVINLDQAYQTFEKNIDDSMKAAGTSVKDFKSKVKNDISGSDGVVKQSNKAAKAVKDMKDDMKTAFKNAATAVTTWQKTYSEQIGKVIKSNEKLYKDLGTLIKRLGEAEKAIISYNETAGTEGGGSGTGSNSSGVSNVNGNVDPDNAGNSSTGGGGKEPHWVKARSITIDSGMGDYDSYTKIDPTKTHKVNGTVYVYAPDYGAWVPTNKVFYSPYFGYNMTYNDAIKDGQWANDIFDRWIIENGITGYQELKYYDENGKMTTYDTGGYTGAWGPEGRIAMLHQKELILNAQDTENFLLATGILREIVNKIELASLAATLKSNAAAQGLEQDLKSKFEQNVTIHAEFPDATNHNEIEEAFNNLLNRASQYANRK